MTEKNKQFFKINRMSFKNVIFGTLAKKQPRLYLWLNESKLCVSTFTPKEALSRLTVISFSGKLIFNGVQGHWHASIKIAIFKTLRRLDTTWNFVCSITRVSTHERKHWEHCLCMQSLVKRFLNYSPEKLDLWRIAVMSDKKCRSPSVT